MKDLEDSPSVGRSRPRRDGERDLPGIIGREYRRVPETDINPSSNVTLGEYLCDAGGRGGSTETHDSGPLRKIWLMRERHSGGKPDNREQVGGGFLLVLSLTSQRLCL